MSTKITEIDACDLFNTHGVDLITQRFAIIKNVFPQNEFENQIASYARKLCHHLFETHELKLSQTEYTINWETRSIIPQAPELVYQIKNSCSHGQPLMSSLLFQSPLGKYFREKLTSNNLEFGAGRLRFQPADHQNHPLHQDLKFHPSKRFFTFWIPVIPIGQITNKDTAGLELFSPPVNKLLETQDGLNDIKQSELSSYYSEENQEKHFLHPQLQLGDVLLFRETVPHGSYIPKSAHSSRTSFDFRLSF